MSDERPFPRRRVAASRPFVCRIDGVHCPSREPSQRLRFPFPLLAPYGSPCGAFSFPSGPWIPPVSRIHSRTPPAPRPGRSRSPPPSDETCPTRSDPGCPIPCPCRCRPPIPHTEFGILKLEMLMPWHRVVERDRAGQLDGAGWSGWMERFSIPRFQPREPRFRNLMRKHLSDALATPSSACAGHPHPATQSPTSTHPPEGPEKPPPSAGRLETPPQRLGVAVFNSLRRGSDKTPS